MKTRSKLARVLTAGALALGLTAVTATPAEAWQYYSTSRYCNWPYKVSIGAYTTVGVRLTIKAYSPGGTYLGSKSGYGNVQWATPWEDLSIRLDGPNTITYSTWCRW